MGYTTKELFSNCLSAYYVALINTWYAWGIRGKKFPLLWLPLTTLRNVVRMLANLALRLHAWPEDITCEPAMTMEDTIEYWFGLLKSWKKGVNGTSTTANALMAAQLLHLRNSTHRTQASSSRKISAADRSEFAALARQAFDDAATFASCCLVDCSASAIKSNVEEWYNETGKALLIGDASISEVVDDEPDDLPELQEKYEDDDSEDEENSHDFSKSVCHAIEAAETDLILTTELHKIQEELPAAHDPTDEAEDVNLNCGSESEIETTEPPAKKEKTGAIPKTLHDVLEFSELANFDPGKKDSESLRRQRLAALNPHMRAFSSYARCAEGILSKAVIAGHRRKAHEQWIFEKELALARAEYQCSAQRQSRHSLWAQYSERVHKVVSSMAENGDEEAAKAAVECKILTPMSFTNDSGCRACQLLVVRPMKSGSLKLGVISTLWRGGKDKKRSKQYIWSERSLPQYAATMMHIKLLLPAGEQDENKWELLTADSFSPVVALDPSDDGSLIMEIPQSRFKHSFEDRCLKVWISKSSIKAIAKIYESSIPFEVKKKGSEDVMSKTYFTENDFQRNQAGVKNLTRYMAQMRRDFETHFHELVSESGLVRLRKDTKVSWEELVARVPSYFKRYCRNSSHWKEMSKESQSKSFPAVILYCFLYYSDRPPHVGNPGNSSFSLTFVRVVVFLKKHNT
ncbi:Uncharacterized protein SCF082_LOCUS20468 [Durusdinium trenchii]|uniref:Uncharacterized protein n=1 Tax=Durusdinium trenchii TaxID=1381693 RepID=A0ABP0L2L3_9DINO